MCDVCEVLLLLFLLHHKFAATYCKSARGAACYFILRVHSLSNILSLAASGRFIFTPALCADGVHAAFLAAAAQRSYIYLLSCIYALLVDAVGSLLDARSHRPSTLTSFLHPSANF